MQGGCRERDNRASRFPRIRRRLFRADIVQGRNGVIRVLHPILRLAHAWNDRPAWTSSTRSSGTPTVARARARIQTAGPNGNAGADGMASIIAHELEEAVTDPDLNAWYDRRGQENADKCAWTFGITDTATNGSKANMTAAVIAKFLIQRNWVNASGGYCALSY